MAANFEASEYDALPAGLYPAKVVSIEKKSPTDPSAGFGDYLRWTFLVQQANGTPTTLSANSSTATGPKSKAHKWATAILGAAPKAGQPVDLAGRYCQLSLIVNEDGFNRIDTILPAASTPTAAARPDDAPFQAPAPAAPVSSDIPF
jgi:hypothetical protein